MKKHSLIGLFGGTFDPIHNGHLAVAQSLLQQLPFKAIHFIVAKCSPLRLLPYADDQHRLAMVKLALSSQPQLIADDIELQRPAPSYTIDTLKLFNTRYAKHTLCVIIGADAFAYFNQWQDYQDIFNYCHLVIVNRPGDYPKQSDWQTTLLKQRQQFDVTEIERCHYGHIYCLEIPPVATNATEIRHALAQGRNIGHLINPKVSDYIRDHQLYTQTG